MFLHVFFRALAPALLLATAALPARAAPSHMTLGQTALPPDAYVDLCLRQPLACGPDAAQVLAGAAQARAERLALAGGPAAPPSPAFAVDPPPPALTSALRAALAEVNARVNRAIRPVKDAAAGDDWSLPLADGRRAGDCEDYALEKLRALAARGVPRSALNLAVAVTPGGESHAVLVVSTADGDFVLDNLSPEVRRWDAVPYAWTKRQVAGAPFRWAMVPKARSPLL